MGIECQRDRAEGMEGGTERVHDRLDKKERGITQLKTVAEGRERDTVIHMSKMVRMK